MDFKDIDIKKFNERIFKLIDDDWGLIVVKDQHKMDKKNNYEVRVNLMTASWITFGILWHRPVVFVFIRPTRYSYGLMEKEDYFSINFFEEKYRKQLEFCGTKSGREYDKVKECNFTVGMFEDKRNKKSNYRDLSIPYIKESRLIFLCKKIYYDDIKPSNFLDKSIEKHYNNDYHRIYIGEIISILEKN